MARRQDAPPSSRQPNSPSPVNKSALLSIGPFFGAGRRRSADRSAAAQERRDAAAVIAETLVEGGLSPDEVYLTPAEIGDTLLALDGSDHRDWLGRPRRAWVGYPDHAHILKTRVGREYALYAEAQGIEKVIQVVIRPPESTFNLTDFATRHAADSKTLSEKLRYARKTRAPGFDWDVITAEIQNVGRGGWLVDVHFHLTTRGVDENDLRKIQTYFESRGWALSVNYASGVLQRKSPGQGGAGRWWNGHEKARARRSRRGYRVSRRAVARFRLMRSVKFLVTPA